MKNRQTGPIALLALLLLLCITPGAAADAKVSEENLDGVWELVSYQFSDRTPEVSGVQLFQDGHFSIAYNMKFPEGELSARSHAGEFSVENGDIVYNVNWWVQDVEGECSIAEPGQEKPSVDYDGSNLILSFSSGSVQHWRRISPAPAL
jgi:hypothetical protein